MIKLFLVLNNLGKPRIEKFFISFTNDEKIQIIKKVFGIALTLQDDCCNFFEDDQLFPNCKIIIRQDNNDQLLKRKYGSLYFILVIDQFESELGILDLIQIIVEGLNSIFPNASESDLMLNPDKANQLIDEIIIGGEVIETNLQEILSTVSAQNALLAAGK